MLAIEDVLVALAKTCDGALKRDYLGFSRADAQEGGRLSAMKLAGLPWSTKDSLRAVAIVQKYADQASVLISKDRAAQKNIARALRGGSAQLRDPTSPTEVKASYFGLSPGGRSIYLWKMGWINDLPRLNAQLRAVASERHGERRISLSLNEKSVGHTINGEKVEHDRMSIDCNGTTIKAIMQIAKAFDLPIDPSIRKGMDREVDFLRRSRQAAWVEQNHESEDPKAWVVIDFETKNVDFIQYIKRALRGEFTCEERDDYNWYVNLRNAHKDCIREIVDRFEINASYELKRWLKPSKEEALFSAMTE